MKITLFVVCLALTANVAIFKSLNSGTLDEGHEYETHLLNRKIRQASFEDETTFFDQNTASVKVGGRSETKFPLRTVRDGAPEQPQKIRLRGDRDMTANEGRVEVYDSKAKIWGLICDDYWSLLDANVTCRQLGFPKRAREATRQDRYGKGEWTVNDYIIQKTKCSGKEKNIMDCPHQRTSYCSGKSAGVSCIYNTGCPPDWIAFNGACFRIYTQKLDYRSAETFCQDQNAKLTYILKASENNFLTNVLYTQYKEISQIWTGGYYAEMKLDDGNSEFRWNWYSTIHNVHQWKTSSLWFPGYYGSKTDQRPRGNLKTKSCVAMSRIYADSQRNNKIYDVNYFWWDNLSCKEKLPYICQMNIPHTRSDCYDNNGFDYRGRISRTVQGSSCAKWTHPSASVNPTSNPGVGLGDHNYCRNPDNDVKPWCWTSPENGVYGYCAIGKCSEIITPDAPLKPSIIDPSGFGLGGCQSNEYHCPSMITYNRQCIHKNEVCDKISNCNLKEDEDPKFCKTYLCKETEFFCEADVFCILKSHVCDGKRNCADGADEKNCPKMEESTISKEYDKFDSKILMLDEKLSYYNFPIDKCSDQCKVIFSQFACRSFNYLPPNESRGYSECHLMNKVQSEVPDKLITINYPGAHYSLKINCKDSDFKCTSGKCIGLEKKCNGRDDCGDNSDENGCATVVFPPFEIRLTGSQNKWEGKVEVRYQGEWGYVCDDGFDMKTAEVVCKQLGYIGAMEAIQSAVNRFGKTRAPIILLDDIQCKGQENSIEDCQHSPWKTHNCQPDEIAGAVCKVDRACDNTEFRCEKDKICIDITKVCDKTNDCSDGADEPEGKCTVKAFLVDGPDKNSGIVELSRAYTRGTVCDDGYDDKDAAVLCRMLGIPGRALAVKDKRFGKGRGTIVLDNLMCNGNEDNVQNCPSFKWGSHRCTHDEDIGLICGLPEAVVTQAPVVPTVPKQETGSTPKCGQRPIIQKRSRVVGGFEAMYGAFPWQVGVRQKMDDYDQHWCGATILSEDWIISAAHCYARPKNEYRVRTGDYDNTVDDKYEQVFEIQELIIHPQWDRSIYDHDLALIKIERNDGVGIRFNNYVQPICLPKLGMVPDPHTKCYVSGWGDTLAEYPEKLLAAEVPLISHERCTEFYKGRLTERMQCAGYEAGGIDTCQGDSGGPLVCKVNGIYTIFGATSWGNGCALPRNPGVYAKIQIMIDWVKQQTGLS